MKLSELTDEYLRSVGLLGVSMHTDASDELRIVHTPEALEQAKSEIISRYGDVNIIVDPKAPWFDQVRIDDEKWKKDHKEYCNRKAEWCRKNTSE